VTLQDATLYKGGKLVGLVVGPDDKPVVGAEALVDFGSSREGGHASATADAAGKFVLAGLPTGRYAVTVSPPAGSACCEQEFDGVVVIGGLALEQRLKMPAGATVSGTVVGPDGAPVAGATIYTSFGYTHGPRTVTDIKGQFKVTGLPSGLKQAGRDPRSAKMTISAVPPESAPTLMGANAPLKDLAPGKTSEIAIRLEAGAAVTGLVTGADGKPVSGCRVSAFSTLGRGGGYSASAVTLTGADGRYVLGQVPPGKWQIGAAPPAGRNLMPQAAASKALAAGRTETVDLALKGAAVITGRVATAAGQPVPGASLRLETGRDASSLFMPGMEQGGRTAFTDSTGSFRFDSVPPGTHKVQCEPLDPRLLVEPAEAKVAGTAAQQVQMVARLTGSIRGTVRDAAGGPVGGEFLFVRLDRPEADAKTQGPTAYPDAEGRFRFGRVLPGKYNLIVVVNKRGTEKNLAAPTPAEVAVAELRETAVDIKVPAK
jgi:protocatechuate 3,4-dioxygenase beta subunit